MSETDKTNIPNLSTYEAAQAAHPGSSTEALRYEATKDGAEVLHAAGVEAPQPIDIAQAGEPHT